MSDEQIQEKYKNNDIADIIKKKETVIVKSDVLPEIIKTKTKSGNTLWTLENNQDQNENYNAIKSKLDSIIKRCHDLLYSRGGSIVGTKAQTDIMRILCLKILQSQFNDENSELWERCNQVKANTNMSDKQFTRFKTYCNDLTEFTKKDDVFHEWKQFVNKFLTKVFPSIYYDNDNKFNCDKSQCIIELITIIDSLEIDEAFKDAFSTTCGDIHESFRAYGGGKGAKELGQYFTPRHLIHLMFHGIGLDKLFHKIENTTIYDPCMGTGGFLTRMFKMTNIPSENIYGCETEIDTIKFGEMSMVLTTGNSRNNIIKCDSLCENPYILDKKFGCIITNPPFGTKMKYKNLKETYEKTFPDSPVKFEDIYPIVTNNGACLFVQHCVYMLAEGGFCAIVLPDGELFDGNSKWSKSFRKWLSETVNIRTILKVPSGTFEHAGVKTNVVVFTKDGPTQNIQFMETTKECNVVKDIFAGSSEELKTAGYSLDIGEYLVEETYNYEVPMVALDEICDIVNGTRIVKKNNIEGIYPVYGSGDQSFTSNRFNREGDTTIIGRFALSEKCVRIIRNKKLFLNDSGISINCNDKKLKEYVSYYLLFNQSIVYDISRGQAQRNLNMDKFPNIKIPLPSLEIQKQIIDELSQIETSIGTIETRISQLKREKDQYKKYGRKADIRELLKDSEEKMLSEVCEINKSSIKKDDNYSKIKYLDLSSVNEGIIKEIKTINYKEKPSRASRKCNIGDILLGATRPNLRNHCIITDDIYSNNLIVSTAFIVLTPNNVLSKYIFYLIMGDDMTNTLISKCRSDPPAINMANTSLVKIPVPSQEIQQQCIQLFEEKETSIQTFDKRITQGKADIDNLKQLAKDVISSFC